MLYMQQNAMKLLIYSFMNWPLSYACNSYLESCEDAVSEKDPDEKATILTSCLCIAGGC